MLFFELKKKHLRYILAKHITIKWLPVFWARSHCCKKLTCLLCVFSPIFTSFLKKLKKNCSNHPCMKSWPMDLEAAGKVGPSILAPKKTRSLNFFHLWKLFHSNWRFSLKTGNLLSGMKKFQGGNFLKWLTFLVITFQRKSFEVRSYWWTEFSAAELESPFYAVCTSRQKRQKKTSGNKYMSRL